MKLKRKKQMRNIGILLFSLMLLAGAFLLPVGIIKVLNKADFKIPISAENYIITSSIIAGFLITLFIIDTIILKFKNKKNGNEDRNNS